MNVKSNSTENMRNMRRKRWRMRREEENTISWRNTMIMMIKERNMKNKNITNDNNEHTR